VAAIWTPAAVRSPPPAKSSVARLVIGVSRISHAVTHRVSAGARCRITLAVGWVVRVAQPGPGPTVSSPAGRPFPQSRTAVARHASAQPHRPWRGSGPCRAERRPRRRHGRRSGQLGTATAFLIELLPPPNTPCCAYCRTEGCAGRAGAIARRSRYRRPYVRGAGGQLPLAPSCAAPFSSGVRRPVRHQL
jgi:hypothetical protein